MKLLFQEKITKTSHLLIWVRLVFKFFRIIVKNCLFQETLTKLCSKEYQFWRITCTKLQYSIIDQDLQISFAQYFRIKEEIERQFSEKSKTFIQSDSLNQKQQFTTHNQGTTSSILDSIQKLISLDFFKKIIIDWISERYNIYFRI